MNIIKKILVGTLMSVTLVGTSVSAADVYKVTPDIGLNVRKGAGVSSEKLTAITKNTRVIITEENSDSTWARVRTGELEGWVCKQYLVKTSSESQSAEAASPQVSTTQKTVNSNNSRTQYSGNSFMQAGVIYWNSYRWTWYSQRILPGGGLNIPGRHADSNGYVCDSSGYICLASNDLPKGTVVSTPFGKQGKVYDCGCASGTLDVYTNW